MHPQRLSNVRFDRRTLLLASGAAVVAAACSGEQRASTTTAPSSAPATSDAPATTPEPATGAPSTTATTAATTESSAPATEAGALTAADFAGLGSCLLLPETTAGPFPLDEQFDRRDITEGYPGHPVRLGLRVVDSACTPIAGAAVEIWHADATGDYSAFTDNGGGKDEGQGTTFLRGTQTAGDDGIVEFLTLYPGWYSGRTVHIHLRVHIDGNTVLTSQLFFDEDYTAAVYATAPYADNGLPDTSNASDNIAGDPEADGTLLHMVAAETTAGTGTLALLNLAISG